MRSISFLALLLATTVAACRHRDADSEDGGAKVRVQSGTAGGGDASAVLAEGDIRIISMDSAIDLAMIGDTISSGLSPQTLAKVRRETDSGTVQGNGLGASIEKMVKGTVQSAIGTRVVLPLSAVRLARYQNGKIEFDWTGKPATHFTRANVNSKGMLESFSPAESQRLVDAVNARLKTRKTM